MKLCHSLWNRMQMLRMTVAGTPEFACPLQVTSFPEPLLCRSHNCFPTLGPGFTGGILTSAGPGRETLSGVWDGLWRLSSFSISGEQRKAGAGTVISETSAYPRGC